MNKFITLKKIQIPMTVLSKLQLILFMLFWTLFQSSAAEFAIVVTICLIEASTTFIG